MAPSYQDAVQQLLRLGHEGRALKWDLVNIGELLERLGQPQRRFASVHIAGTNGKGSVAALAESILRRAGYCTGLYTSPHLVEMNERIAVNGRAISEEDFAAAFAALRGPIEGLLADPGARGGRQHPSFFECLTAMAFWHFAQVGVELAVVEVGLGGRLDATNVLEPAVGAITSIDFDHERYLGHSIEQIAGEKAGIIKPGLPLINSAEHPVARQVIAARAKELEAPVIDPEVEYPVAALHSSDLGRYQFSLRPPEGCELHLEPALRGRFQVRNTITAVAIVRELNKQGWRVGSEAIEAGVREARWPGRLELVGGLAEANPAERPLLFLDGAHNPAGARQVRRFWEEHLSGRPIHLVYGTLRDKAVGEVAELLFPFAASIMVTEPATPRATSTTLLARLAQAFQRDTRVEPDPSQALARALEGAAPGDVVFVTGSLLLVGDCKRALLARDAPRLPGLAPAPEVVGFDSPGGPPLS